MDGFNVLHAGVLVGRDRADWWKAAAQQRLVERVERFSDVSCAEIWIIFDRRADWHEASAVTSADTRLAIYYAPSADDWIVEQVRVLAPQRSVTVVTADRLLRERARQVGAALSSPQQFLSACG
ncbi:MAG: NYN domain-containing protein [Deltaproteobacteria bacterium]|nr:NYN domain-containing protein [Deltaproteobacteria bacterium]